MSDVCVCTFLQRQVLFDQVAFVAGRGVANTVLGEDPATFIILASHQPKPYDTRREKRLRKGSCRCCRAKSTRYEDTKTKMLRAFRSMECEMR